MVLVRAGEERDIPAVAALARTMASSHRFALVPTEDYVRFSLSKKRLLAGFLPPGLLSVEFFIVEEGAGAVAFAILTVTSDDVILEMCGDRDPAGARRRRAAAGAARPDAGRDGDQHRLLPSARLAAAAGRDRQRERADGRASVMMVRAADRHGDLFDCHARCAGP